jgi:hypothetical protein
MFKKLTVPISIFIIALLPRVLFLNLIEFKADEALTVLAIEQFVKHPHLIQYGLYSSVGVKNFPLFNYLLIIPGIVSQDPQFLSGIIGFLNAIAIVFFYLITKKYYGQKIALFSSIIFATNPWSILFSRKIWAQDLVPLFAIPIYYFLHRVIKDKHHGSVIPLYISLILAAQLHASCLFFTIIVSIYLFKTKTVFLKNACTGIVIGLIPAVPYFTYQLTSNPTCPDCQSYSIHASQFSKSIDFENLYLPFSFVGGLGWESISGTNFPIPIYFKVVWVLEIICLIWGVFLVIKQKKKLGFIVTMIFGLPLIYLIAEVPARLHYYQILSPWIMLTIGLSIKKYTNIVWICVILCVSVNLLFLNNFSRFLSLNKQVYSDYGTIYEESKRQVDEATVNYRLRSDYSEIKAMSYFNTNTIHTRLAQYFYNHQEFELAIQELQIKETLDKL